MFEEAKRLENLGRNVIHLSLGEPGPKAPPAVLDAAKEYLDSGNIGYTEPMGTFDLRMAISQHYKRFYNLEIPFSRIGVTSGASGAFVLTFLALFDVGDNVAIFSPYYPAYVNILEALGINVILLEAQEENNFQVSEKQVKNLSKKVDGLIISSPCNPVGSVIKNDTLLEIINVCQSKKIKLISDEIYHGITYSQERPISALSGNKDSIIINSFSKYFTMTGWRLGWVIMPKEMTNIFSKLSMNLYLSPSSLAQFAALKAFNDYQLLDKNVTKYRNNRDLLIKGLNTLGIKKIVKPDGAFYIYANIKGLGLNSTEFCKRMLSEALVSAVPGLDFDKKRGHNFIRFSYAGPKDDIIEAVKRMKKWLK